MLLKFDENAVSYDKLGRSGSSCGNCVVKVAYFILIKLEKFSSVTVFRHKLANWGRQQEGTECLGK